MTDIFDKNSFKTYLATNDTFTFETMQKAIDLIKDLEEKYPKPKDDIDIFLITNNNLLIPPETILKSKYENKNYVMMNVSDFAKLMAESKNMIYHNTFQNMLYEGDYSWCGIPIWYDDDLIIKILNYHVDNMMKKYEDEINKNIINSFRIPNKYFWNSKDGIS